MDEGLVHAELLAACSSLGYSNGVTYQCEADCLETIKDLLRYLRKDDDRHEVRRALGDTRVMQTDLLPILQQHSDNEELLQLVVRLMVDLTNPALLLFREELPEEKVTRQQFMQLVRQQQGYKEAFTNHKAWKVMAARLRAILEIPVEEREEDHRLLLERMLVLVRNVLWAPANPQEGRTDDDASVHDQVLWAMHLSGMAELLLYMASSLSEHDMALHLLEIISLMLREQDAVCLATSNLHGSNQEKEEDNRKLQELRLQESLQREARRRASASRHSRFGGTYVVRQVKSISEQDLILHRPLANPSAISFDRNKRPRKHNKNRRPVQESTTTRRSTLAVRMFLQEFCVEFVSGSYNAIMSTVKDALDRVRAQDHDETYYLWSIRFFMEFNRHHNFKVELVTETMGIETFHFIQTHVDNYFDMMGMEKKKRAVWSRRMHRALRAYHELLATLAHMDASPLQDVRESSRVLKSRLFYMVEYREMMLLLLQNYDPIKMSMGYLRDAVEAAHVFLKLLEGTCKRGRHIMVQGKGRKAHKKKKAKATPAPAVLTQDQLQDLWDELSPEVVAVVQGEAHNLPEVVPFDALSEDPEDVQKEAAMRRISKHLKDKELPMAVALLRAAREVWPEGDIFGPQESDHTQDFLTLQEIFLANLSSPQDTPVQEEVEEEYGDEEEEEEEERAVFSEQELDFEGFVRRFASTKVVKAYSHLLQHYQTNTKHTNHCILKMFHRLAWDCKLPAIFFQASLFIVFLKAMQDPLRQSSESPREIARFGKYIMRQLYKVAEVNPKVFVELLFWKTNKEALEIECGYGEQEAGKAAAKLAWTEEEDDELKILYEEAEQMPAEERGENDIVDLIMDRLISRTRTRRTVIRKLRDMGLITSAKGLKRGSAPRINAPRTWTEEEEEELRRLYQENKEAMDIVGRIMDGLTLRRPKHRVVEKMLELGIVEDRKALRKKRAKKPTTRKPKKTGQDFLSANQGSDEEGDEGSGSEGTSGSESEDEDSNTNTHQSTTNPPPPPPSVPVVTPALISQGLGVVLGAGLGEAVEWLARIMRDVADDREEDGDFEPVPILAITQPCTTAMEDQEFHKLMRLVGLQPPMIHQEMFWRVPSRLSVAGLRKRAEYLTQGAAGGLQDIQNPDEPLEPVEGVQPAQVEPQKPKKTPKPKKTKTPRNSKAKTTPKVSSNSRSSEDKENHLNGDDNDGDGDDDGDGDGPTTLLQLLPHDDSSGDDAPLASLTARPSPPSSHPANRVNKRMLSDDSDEHTPQTNTTNKDKKTKKKKKRLVLDSDSEEEMDAGVREEEGSEGENQAEVVLQPSRKQRIRAIIDSDDD